MHRLSRRRRAVPLLLALTASLLVLAFAAPAQASTVTLVSNMAQETARAAGATVGRFTSRNTVNYVQAQTFTTGSNTGGYRLSAVAVNVLSPDSRAALAVGIYTDNSGEPGRELYRLIGSVANTGVAKFYATPGANLDANTTYFLVLINDDGEYHYFKTAKTDADREDAGSLTGFSIGDSRLEKWVTNNLEQPCSPRRDIYCIKPEELNVWHTGRQALKMSVRGFAIGTEDSNTPNLPQTENNVLTAHFQDLPAAHDGQSSFKFALLFNQEVNLRFRAMKDYALQVTGGTVVRLQRLEPPGNQRWEYTLRPNSGGEISIVIPAPSDCAATGAVCTSGGKKLSAAASVTVPGPGGTPESPEITSSSSFMVLEGETAVATLTATDSDTQAADLTWSVPSGAAAGTDGGKFTISAAGVLALAAAKDFEDPDDADNDGSYQVAVQVSDGGRSDTANLTVTLSNRNEAPTANAGNDRADISGGTTVTLAGTGTDPDAGDQLSYAWTQTSGTNVTLANDDTAGATFDAPTGLSTDEILTFSLRVTDGAGLYHEDTVSVTVVAGDALTVEFENVPASHDGSTAFTVGLRFSENVAVLSYRTVGGGLLNVTGARVDGARRLTPGSNQRWEVRITPTQNGNITISLPVRSCGEANAICVDNRALASAVSKTVSGRPFTASFSQAPAADADSALEAAKHDGSTPFEIYFHLSHDVPGLSYTTVGGRNVLFEVTNGRVDGAKRREPGKNRKWIVTIAPNGASDVTVRVRATTDCAGSPGVCDADGRMLPGGLQTIITGPSLSVADAEVREAVGATLGFTVTQSNQRAWATTVRYATSDGTATAGQDYTAASGTLRIPAGDIQATINVTVLDDDIDDDSATLTLTLSNASGAKIGDGTATGTIRNTDPLPNGWLARFGRTSAVQVVTLLNARFDEAARADSRLTLGGRAVQLRSSFPRRQEFSEQTITASDTSDHIPRHDDQAGSFGQPQPESSCPSMLNPGQIGTEQGTDLNSVPGQVEAQAGEATLLERALWTLLTNRGSLQFDKRQSISRSSFNLSLSDSSFLRRQESSETHGRADNTLETITATSETPGHWSLWGRGALTHFSGTDESVDISGDVLSGLLGVDYARNRWLAGVALAYHDGDGTYRSARNDGAGRLNSALVSVNPYLRYALTDRLSVWGTLGYGAGTLQLRQTGSDLSPTPIETDMRMGMGALGLRGVVYASARTELALKTDALWVRTASDEVPGMQAVESADNSRVRLLLSGRHQRALANNALLAPGFELGIRYDDGEAERGFGMELGGGLRYADPVRGLTVETRARALVAHEDGGYEEWGVSGSLALDPGRLARGLALRLDSGWGITDSGAEALWQRQTTAGISPHHNPAAQGRIKAEMGYGLDVPWTYGILTPYSGMEWAGSSRSLRLGWRFNLGQSLSLNLDGERRESGHGKPEHGVMLRTTLPW